jgi:hypothetical protein
VRELTPSWRVRSSAETLFFAWVRRCIAKDQLVSGSLFALKTQPLDAALDPSATSTALISSPQSRRSQGRSAQSKATRRTARSCTRWQASLLVTLH